MTLHIDNLGVELPEEVLTGEIPPKGDLAINRYETMKDPLAIINRTDYEEATKRLVRLAIKDNDVASIEGILDNLKLLETKKDQFQVTVDLDGRIDAIEKILEIMKSNQDQNR